MEDIAFEQSGSDTLRELGLVHRYGVHIDVVNDETGFALYVDTPPESDDDGAWWPFFTKSDDVYARSVHVDDYVPGAEPEYHYGHWFDRAYLRIREIDDEGNPGEWHTIRLNLAHFVKNTDAPDVLDEMGFGRFDSVTCWTAWRPERITRCRCGLTVTIVRTGN